MDTVSSCWNNAEYKMDSAQRLNFKFKLIRKRLRKWSRNLSNPTKSFPTVTIHWLSLMDRNIRDPYPQLNKTLEEFEKIIQEK
jgi:hypothetical protein